MENKGLNNLAITRDLKMEATPEPGIIKAPRDGIIYSAKTPQGRLSLEELARWLTGRYNIFRPASGIAPLPELAGQIKPSITPGKESKEPSNSKGTQHSSITGAVYEPFSYLEPESESVWIK
jgi:type IV pilus assembly protein PilO